MWANYFSEDTLKILKLLWVSLGETIYMTFTATFFAGLIGIPLGVILYSTRKGQFLNNASIYYPLSFVVNVGRSIPYMILAISIIPFIRFIVGVSIGNTAAIIPLTIAAIPFVARMIENILNEVPSGLIESAQAMGATPVQIVQKVLLPEALSGIINSITIVLISLIGYSAIAGALGAGGLGKMAYNYGYLRYRPDIIVYTITVIVLLVQAIQFFGDYLVKKTSHR